jgi:hypothetical protein
MGEPGGSPCDGEAPRAWLPLPSTDQPRARTNPRVLATERGMVVLGGVAATTGAQTTESGAIYDLCADAWTPIGPTPFGVEAVEPVAFVPIVAWTGSGILVWGGYERTPGAYEEGEPVQLASRFDLADMAWSAMQRSGEPTVRETAAMLWTGSRLLVWGGAAQSGDRTWVNHADGALYDPATDSWSPMASAGAPSGRGFSSPPIWTGEKLIVWGGFRLLTGMGVGPAVETPTDGAIYDAASDSWTAIPPGGPLVAMQVWTGDELIAIGELDGQTTPGTVVFDGAVFDPVASTWSEMRAPEASMVTGVIDAGRRLFWSGTELLVLAQRIDAGRGRAVLLRYDLGAEAWSSVEVPAVPELAYWQDVALADGKLVISGQGPFTNAPGEPRHHTTQVIVFDVASSSWTSLPLLEDRGFPAVVVSAGQALMWGGADIYPDPAGPLSCIPNEPICDPITPTITDLLADGARIGL